MTFIISDPWEVMDEIGSGPFEINPLAPIALDGNHFYALWRPLRCQSTDFSYVGLSARHVGKTLADNYRSSVPCNIYSLTDREGESKLMDESIPWSERVKMIGTFESKETKK